MQRKYHSLHCQIYYTRFEEPLPPAVFERLMQAMPGPVRLHTLSYKRWQDAHAHLLGRVLLQQAIAENGYNCKLSGLEYNQAGKPFLRGMPDFSITHSGTLTACAIADKGHIGIDAEEVKSIDFTALRSFFSLAEWQQLLSAPAPEPLFYRCWTSKEAILKAAGSGIPADLSVLSTVTNPAFYEGKYWHFREIALHSNYICHIAADDPELSCTVKELKF